MYITCNVYYKCMLSVYLHSVVSEDSLWDQDELFPSVPETPPPPPPQRLQPPTLVVGWRMTTFAAALWVNELKIPFCRCQEGALRVCMLVQTPFQSTILENTVLFCFFFSLWWEVSGGWGWGGGLLVPVGGGSALAPSLKNESEWGKSILPCNLFPFGNHFNLVLVNNSPHARIHLTCCDSPSPQKKKEKKSSGRTRRVYLLRRRYTDKLIQRATITFMSERFPTKWWIPSGIFKCVRISKGRSASFFIHFSSLLLSPF